jgi:hypothetical protein
LLEKKETNKQHQHYSSHNLQRHSSSTEPTLKKWSEERGKENLKKSKSQYWQSRSNP